MDGKLGTGRSDNLLLLSPSKLTQNGLSDRSRGLDRQGVHEHVRGGSHGGQLAHGLAPKNTKQKDASCTRNCSPGDAVITSIPLLLGGVR